MEAPLLAAIAALATAVAGLFAMLKESWKTRAEEWKAQAGDWKTKFEAEDRDHAKTLKWAERLADQVIDLGAKPSRPSSEPPATTMRTTTSQRR